MESTTRRLDLNPGRCAVHRLDADIEHACRPIGALMLHRGERIVDSAARGSGMVQCVCPSMLIPVYTAQYNVLSTESKN